MDWTAYLWLLLCYCSPGEGFLEQAIDTVQKTFNLNSRQPFQLSELIQAPDNKNESLHDATSMHIKNQDFKIVLGKAGLETLDSILDKVFNFTTELHERNERFNIINRNSNNIGPNQIHSLSGNVETGLSSISGLPGAFGKPSTHEFIKVLNGEVSNNGPMFESHQVAEQTFNVQSISDKLKTVDANEIQTLRSRRRPILTYRDAPHYFDPILGILKVNSFADVDDVTAQQNFDELNSLNRFNETSRSKYYKNRAKAIITLPSQRFQLPELSEDRPNANLLNSAQAGRKYPELQKLPQSSIKPEKIITFPTEPEAAVYTEDDLVMFNNISR